MSKWFYQIILLLVICLVACDVSDAEWAKTIPGKYEGIGQRFREIVELNPDATFNHRVYIDGKAVVNEQGHWKFRDGSVMLDPMTSFYDPKSDRLTLNGRPMSLGAFAVLRYGKAAEQMTQSINHEFCLIKEKKHLER